MITPAKTADKELMFEIGELIKQLTRIPEAHEIMLKYIEHYKNLDEKLKTHDYSKENELITRADDRMK